MGSPIVELISKKLVAPSFPTPPALENYSLSLLDQLWTSRYVPLALFYRPNNPDNTSKMSRVLEESLSKTLASYYPLVGTLTDNIGVTCNQTAPATFLEVHIRCPMSEILNAADVNALNVVFPAGIPWSYADDQSSNVIAQLNHFDCGGIALGVCVRHKLGDGYTLCNFINDWATMARQPTAQLSPQFMGASVLPPSDDPSSQPVFDVHEAHNCITKRFVFDPEKLRQLKSKVTAEAGVQNPTRVEVVTALIYKCAMVASLVNSQSFRPSVFGFLVNLRPLLGPPVTQNFRGNLISKFYVSTNDETEISLSRLVSQIREAKVQFYEKHRGIKTHDLVSATLQRADKVKALLANNNIDEYECSSLCRFPTYGIDFGWGKPIRVSTGPNALKNLFYLLDNHSVDSIEALLTVDEQVMSVFQSDPELLAFASLG